MYLKGRMKIRPFLVYLHMDLKNFDTVIFDLGGVIINLNYQLTIDAFIELGVKDLNFTYSQAQQVSLFDEYETGQISTQQFINTIKKYVPSEITPNQIVHAWNAMILDFPSENLEFLEELSKHKNIYLLSNTNDLHLQKVNQTLALKTSKTLSEYFIKVYYSQEIKMRKPHPETFQFVCDDAGISAQSTLFIDDTTQHIQGADSIGLNTFLMNQNNLLQDTFTF